MNRNNNFFCDIVNATRICNAFELTLSKALRLKMRVNRQTVTRKPRKADGFCVTRDSIVEHLEKFLNLDLARSSAGKDVRAVQEELRTDILSLLDGASPKSLWDVLIEIVEKVEAMRIPAILAVSPWEPQARKAFSDNNGACNVSGPFEIRGERFFFVDGPDTKPASREYVYWTLYQSLKTGSFPRLRKCPWCPKFFVAKDPKRKFCSDRCKDNYNNKRRAMVGYFTGKKRERRQKAIERAERLLKSGLSIGAVHAKTGFSLNALHRTGLIP
jgi:hypothetical protein